MATLENAAPPGRDARAGEALDAETQQQVAELNLQGIEVIQAALVACGAVAPAADPPASGAAEGGTACRQDGRRRRAGTVRAARGVPVRAGLAVTLAVPGRDGARLPDAIEWPGAEWLALDAVARRHLAACPYLLFELDFAGLFATVAVPPQAVQEARVLPAESGVAPPFGSAEGRCFARLLFHYAWHLARSSPTVAAFVFGTSQPVLEPLRTLGLARVETLAAAASGALRLRWDQEPVMWIDWLSAARAGEPAALWAAQLRGLQRIAGACREVASSM